MFLIYITIIVSQITPKHKKFVEKNAVITRTDDKSQKKLDIPPFIVTNKVNKVL